MVVVKFTPNLKRFFPDLTEYSVEAGTVAEVVAAVDERWQGLASYIVDEHGRLRPHVNIFINEDLVFDKETLSDKVTDGTRIYVMQALSGG